MVPYLGDFKEDQAVYILFNTFTSDDPSASSTITNLADTDIHIHKDGAVAQHSADAAADVSINFDGITGNHLCKINTDSDAFFATGSDYAVRMEGTTVDGATINAWIGSFSIENRHNEVDVVKWLGQACHAVSENGVPKVDLDQIGGVIQSLTDFKDFVDTGYVPGTHSVALVDTTTTNTDMRGTDSAALASVLGALNDVAAAGEVTDADTLVQYIKQLINILIGAAGIGAFPAEAAPANAVSLAEVIRAIHVDVTGLNGDVMRGTDGANTTIPDAAGVAPTAVDFQAEMEANGASILDTLRDDLADGGRLDLIFDSILAMLDDARGEPAQGAPPVNPDAMTKLDYIYKFMRNKLVTSATLIEVYNDAGAVVDHKSTISDDGSDFNRGEFVSGP